MDNTSRHHRNQQVLPLSCAAARQNFNFYIRSAFKARKNGDTRQKAVTRLLWLVING
jgi:hypothetical protein